MSKRLNTGSALSRILSFGLALSMPFMAVAESSDTNCSDNLENEMISPELVRLLNINRVEGIESITQRELSMAVNAMIGIKTTSERTVGYKFEYNEPITKDDFVNYSNYYECHSDAERVDRINQLMANLYEDYRVNGKGNKQYNLFENEYYNELYTIIVNELWRFEIGGRACLQYVHLGNLIEFFRLYFETDLLAFVSKYYDGNKITLECKWEKIRDLEVKDPNCQTYEEALLGEYEHLVSIYMHCLDELNSYMKEHPCEEHIIYGGNSMLLVGNNDDSDTYRTLVTTDAMGNVVEIKGRRRA